MTFIAFIVILLLAKGAIMARNRALHYPHEMIGYAVWKLALALGRLAVVVLAYVVALHSADWLFAHTYSWLNPP